LARARIQAIRPQPLDRAAFDVADHRRRAPRIPFPRLLELGLLEPGQALYFRRDPSLRATVKPDGRLRQGDQEGSIHQLGKALSGGSPCNGWDNWFIEDPVRGWVMLDVLRQQARAALADDEKRSSA
jgi:modification methylase